MKYRLLQILKSYYPSNTKAPLLSNASVYVPAVLYREEVILEGKQVCNNQGF